MDIVITAPDMPTQSTGREATPVPARILTGGEAVRSGPLALALPVPANSRRKGN